MQLNFRAACLAVLTATTFATTAHADKAFDDCIRKLCTSISQQGCWIKVGAAVCDEDQIQCEELPDQVPAIAVKKEGRRWLVQTMFGEGWVSDRMMMIDGGQCSS